jgi:GntR family transcriptional regulator
VDSETSGEDGRPNPRRLIAEQLRNDISTGVYEPGAKLPSGRELAARYKVARNTADDAIKILRAEGLVIIRQGSGAYVRRPRPLVRLGGNRYSRRLRDESGLSPFLLEAFRQGWQAHVEGRSVERVVPPADIAMRLQVEATTASVLRRENWYFADNEPAQVGFTYLPWPIVEGTPLVVPGEPVPTGIDAYLETLGYTVSRIREEISARMPRNDEAADLRVPPGVPVIEVLHTSFNTDGTPFDVTRFVLRADIMGLDYSMPVED